LFRIGVDTGGTFTDCAVITQEKGELKRYKAPSTPKDYSEGVMDVLAIASQDFKMTIKEFLENTEFIIHGTTIATNLILSRGGKDVGLITTKGFRDIIEQWYKEERRYDMRYPPPSPPCPRWLRIEVEERIDFAGKILKELNEKDVLKAIDFFKKHSINSIAVSLIFSPINSVHEKRILDLFEEFYPEAIVQISSEVLPQLREYERTMATVLNAYVAPYASKYLQDLENKLRANGFKKDLLIMQSNSGVSHVNIISKIPVRLALSGPASGPKAALFFSELIGVKNIISVDMGGTSFDICLVKDKVIPTSIDGKIGRFRLALPTVDIHSLGAGGGSIAWIDAGGVLKVGPKSAGASPGPACYDRGGTDPTVTDANLILGYINPENFLGGRMKLNFNLAKKVIEELSEKIGLSLEETAYGIIKVVNNNMIDGIRAVSIKRGHDPKNFTLVAAGGAGPLHAAKLSELAGISKIIIPRIASAFCAFGMTISDLRHDYVQPYITPIRKADLEKINEIFDVLEQKGRETLYSENLKDDQIEFIRSIDMRYIGQIYEVETPIPKIKLTIKNLSEIENLFHERHDKLYGYFDKNSDIELVHLRVKAIGRTKPFKIKRRELGSERPINDAIKPKREAYFEEMGKYIKTMVYDGNKLIPGNIIEGPAIIEENDTTIVVFPRWVCKLDGFNNYILTLKNNSGGDI